MNGRKKDTRPTAATVKRAKMEAQTGQGYASTCNDITVRPEGQGFRVADFLRPGAAHAILRRDLVHITGLPERDLRRQIERERRAGALIISDNQNGYFLAESPEEAQRFARSMQHRAREILRTAQAIEEAAGFD